MSCSHLSGLIFPRVKAVFWESPSTLHALLKPLTEWRHLHRQGPHPLLGPRRQFLDRRQGVKELTDKFLFGEGKERRQEHGTVFSTRRRDSLA